MVIRQLDENVPAPGEATIELIEAGWDGAAMPGSWTPAQLKVTGGAKTPARCSR